MKKNQKNNINKKSNGSRKDTMWIYGKHAVRAVLQNPRREILKFILLDSNKSFGDLEDLAVTENSPETIPAPEYVDKNYFSSVFGEEATHQGCAVLVKKLPRIFLEDIVKENEDTENSAENSHAPIILLDQVADPQNIGSVLRAAAVFGARAVVMPEDHSPEITPTIAKAASGALEKIPLVMVVNLVQSMNFLKKNGYWIVGLDERSDKNLSEIDLRGKFAFIIGNEGDGMRRLSRESCDFVAKLPGPAETFTTLNAAQAATVTLYESCRQRMK